MYSRVFTRPVVIIRGNSALTTSQFRYWSAKLDQSPTTANTTTTAPSNRYWIVRTRMVRLWRVIRRFELTVGIAWVTTDLRSGAGNR